MLEVLQQVAVEQCLPLFLQANRRIELGRRVRGDELPEETHVGRRDLHVDGQVCAREAEQAADLRPREQERIDAECTAPGDVPQGDGERMILGAVDDATHDVRAGVAEEERGEHLHLEVRLLRVVARDVGP